MSATPGRRTTRSMSRETSPGPIGLDADIGLVGRTRKSSKRPVAPAQKSFAYGSRGKEVTSAGLNADDAEQVAVDIVGAAVQSAQNRPIRGTDKETSDGASSVLAIIEEDKEEEESGLRVAGEGRSFGTEKPLGGTVGISKIIQQQLGERPGRHPKSAGNAPRKNVIAPQQRQLHHSSKSSQSSRSSHDRPSQTQPDRPVSSYLAVPREIIVFGQPLWWFLLKWLFVLTMISIFYQSLYYPYLRPTSTASPNATTSAMTETTPKSPLKDYEFRSLSNRLSTIERQFQTLSPNLPKIYRVNYFAPHSGAIIDPHLTSPTLAQTARARTRWFPRIHSYPLRTPSPVTVLQSWDDAGDCWCAPPDDITSQGKSQFTVLLAKNMVPTELQIEHIPRDATLDIGAAPKEVEFWAQILDPEKRALVADAAVSVLAERSSGTPDDSDALTVRRETGTHRALDQTWVRLGVWQYDIYREDNIQGFKMAVGLDDFGAVTSKVSIRVRSNWGTDKKNYTCLYRLKLFGLLAEKDPAEANVVVEEVHKQTVVRTRSP
ncbi:hypothetical protein MMC19_003415 [Ptychographa xylographoides]|nr:hypothetical protein [Ptychographa xylographoides]